MGLLALQGEVVFGSGARGHEMVFVLAMRWMPNPGLAPEIKACDEDR